MRKALHKYATCGLMGEDEIRQIIDTQKAADVSEFQLPKYAFRHSMTDGTRRQSSVAAKIKQRDFLEAQLTAFVNKGNCKALGFALHAVSDTDAPTHSWMAWNASGLGEGSLHFIGEALWAPGNMSMRAQKRKSINAVQIFTEKAIFASLEPNLEIRMKMIKDLASEAAGFVKIPTPTVPTPTIPTPTIVPLPKPTPLPIPGPTPPAPEVPNRFDPPPSQVG